ncbi:MAG: rhodanese-like domain-containing protein [Flammeovirgaceae bacterium]|nr:MAG: rhodanese-like domain-containing protein [Flammeovirgaceae bacterium]
MFNLFSIGSKTYEDLSGKEFKERYQATAGAELIDVRTAGEFNAGTIKGAKNIDFLSSSFKSQFLKLNKEKEYFLFCRSGSRSGQACAILSKEGYKVYNLAGGIADWPR